MENEEIVESVEESEEKLTPSFEDYLEAIVKLGGTTETSVRSVDIHKELGVSKASVSKAISKLKQNGYAEQPYYGDITLTAKGYEIGSAVLERERLLVYFLTEVLSISEEVAEEEACLMEHAISDESFEHWKTYIKKIKGEE